MLHRRVCEIQSQFTAKKTGVLQAHLVLDCIHSLRGPVDLAPIG